MSSKHLPLHTVVGSRIHEEICHAEHKVSAQWQERFRHAQDQQFAQKVGAVPPKEKVNLAPKPPAFGPGGSMVVERSREEIETMTTKQYEAYLMQTSKLWELCSKGQLSVGQFSGGTVVGRLQSLPQPALRLYLGQQSKVVRHVCPSQRTTVTRAPT